MENLWCWPDPPYLYGPTRVDARFNGHIVGGLEKGSLQEQGKEQQYSQHIRILQELFGGNEIDPQQPHLKERELDIDQCITVKVRQVSEACRTGMTLSFLLDSDASESQVSLFLDIASNVYSCIIHLQCSILNSEQPWGIAFEPQSN